jgi:glycosyltransferase involved in cell wall biosynthesis
VPRYLAAADVLVLSSDTEGLPGVVLEAGAAGLPVVATRVGGVTECVADGETGLLVEPGDADALHAALHSLLADPPAARRQGETGRRRVEESFCLDRVAERYAELYLRLAAARPGRPR